MKRFFTNRGPLRPCGAQTLLLLVVILLGTASMLSACGQKGQLYRPDAGQQGQG